MSPTSSRMRPPIFFIEDEDILTIFGAFVAETGHPLNVRKDKKTLEYGGKFRDAAVDKIKASWDTDTLGKLLNFTFMIIFQLLTFI